MEKLMPVFFLDFSVPEKPHVTNACALFKRRLKKYLKKKKEPGIFFALILCPGIIFFKNFFFVCVATVSSELCRN